MKHHGERVDYSQIQYDIQAYLKKHLLFNAGGKSASVQRFLSEYIMQQGEPDNWKTLADQCIERLAQGEPVQYIAGHTWFYDLRLRVDKYVLIPRPETEELVAWMLEDYKSGIIQRSPDVLDIGTGSGCIALAIKKNVPVAHVMAIDISAEALSVAMTNAVNNHLMVEYRQLDILNEDPGRVFDVMVSNPPYVSNEEFALLSSTVQKYEPGIALTPGAEDPLIFYRRLAELGKTHLNKDGRLYLELNEFRAREICALFLNEGYDTDMRKDMQGKWRMLMVRWSTNHFA